MLRRFRKPRPFSAPQFIWPRSPELKDLGNDASELTAAVDAVGVDEDLTTAAIAEGIAEAVEDVTPAEDATPAEDFTLGEAEEVRCRRPRPSPPRLS